MSFANIKWVWMNGTVVPWCDAIIHVSAHALHYGSGVFEGIRCYPSQEGTSLFRVDAHLERLGCSAAAHGMTISLYQQTTNERVCYRNCGGSCSDIAAPSGLLV